MTDPYPATATAPQVPLTTDRPARPLTSRFGAAHKPTYLTTEFIAYVACVLGVLLASVIVQHTDAHEDYFRADRAWLYIVLLTVGYLLSRGLAKTGGGRGSDVSY